MPEHLSVASRLAIAAYRVLWGSSFYSISAALLTINLHQHNTYLEAIRSVAISAYLNCRYCISANLLPNCFLDNRYFLAVYRQKAAPPKLQLAILTLPPSRAFMAILNPIPSGPIRFFYGILTSSKVTNVVGWIDQPIFYSNFPNPSPLVSFSTMKVDTSVGEVLAMTK